MVEEEISNYYKKEEFQEFCRIYIVKSIIINKIICDCKRYIIYKKITKIFINNKGGEGIEKYRII